MRGCLVQNKLLAAKPTERQAGIFGEEMLCRNPNANLFSKQLDRPQTLRFDEFETKTDIDFVVIVANLIRLRRAAFFPKQNGDLRKTALEFADHRRKKMSGNGRDNANSYHSEGSAFDLFHLDASFFDIGNDFFRIGQQNLAGRSENHLSAGAFEQRHSEVLFEPLYLDAERRLRLPQGSCALGEMASSRDSSNASQLINWSSRD